MSREVELMLRWPKEHNGSGAPKSARTKEHTVWANKNDVRRSKYIHWGGNVYAFWRFGSEGALMAFRLEDDLWDAVVPDEDHVDLWCKMGDMQKERVDFLRAIKHDFEHPIYRYIADDIISRSKKGPITGFFEEPWEVNANSLTGAFGAIAKRVSISVITKPDGTKVTSAYIKPE